MSIMCRHKPDLVYTHDRKLLGEKKCMFLFWCTTCWLKSFQPQCFNPQYREALLLQGFRLFKVTEFLYFTPPCQIQAIRLHVDVLQAKIQDTKMDHVNWQGNIHDIIMPEFQFQCWCGTSSKDSWLISSYPVGILVWAVCRSPYC